MRPRPGPWPRSYRGSRRATGAVPSSWGSFGGWCCGAWGWGRYNRQGQGSEPPLYRGPEPRTPIDPKGRTLNKAWRSLGSPTPDTAPWGSSPDIPVRRDGDRTYERGSLVAPDSAPPRLSKETVVGWWRTPFVDSGSPHWSMALFQPSGMSPSACGHAISYRQNRAHRVPRVTGKERNERRSDSQK